MSTPETTPAPVPDEGGQAEARAVCEHFYASHCYRGMSIRLCMMCHQPDWDDLERQLGGAPSAPVAPPLLAAALDPSRVPPSGPERSRPRTDAVADLPLAGCPTGCDADCELNPDGCHESHQPVHMRWHDPGWSCEEVQRAIAEAVAAERAKVTGALTNWRARYPAGGGMADELAGDILAAIGIEEGDGRG